VKATKGNSYQAAKGAKFGKLVLFAAFAPLREPFQAQYVVGHTTIWEKKVECPIHTVV
jgi:hypothetical protein